MKYKSKAFKGMYAMQFKNENAVAFLELCYYWKYVNFYKIHVCLQFEERFYVSKRVDTE